MISVIIPVLSEKVSVSRCLNSIFSQTETDREIIVVDAGSKGMASALINSVEQWKEKVSLIRVTENRQIWNMLRLGVAQARGNHAVIVSEQEWLEPDALATLSSTILELQTDAVQMKKIKRIKGIAVKDSFPYNVPVATPIRGEDFMKIASAVLPESVISTCISDKIYRTDILRETLRLNFSGNWGTGEILNLHYFRHARSIAFIDYGGLNYSGMPPANSYSYSRLRDLRNVYEMKRLTLGPQALPALQDELRARLVEYVSILLSWLGWTYEATMFYLSLELEDRFWKSAGISESAEEIVAEAQRANKRSSLRNIFRSLLR